MNDLSPEMLKRFENWYNLQYKNDRQYYDIMRNLFAYAVNCCKNEGFVE